MRISSVCLGMCLTAFGSVSWAQNSIIYETPPEVGQTTRQWLKVQREGGQASKLPQPLPGPVVTNIYQRYQDSFSHPIPEFFTGDDADASVLGQ